MINYKNTLNLPYTDFPMRGNLAERELDILRQWHKYDLYKTIRYARKGRKIFFLHDGPPYANGSIHLGHSVNKILKDIVIKYKGFMGYDSPYIPGWDCHGLPIELRVEQLVGKPDRTISASKFRIACRNYANVQIEEQKKDFIRLGILGDWNNPYLTMDYITEANIIRTFGKMIANGYLYKGTKPVHWCIDCHSALAEAEIEYCNLISPSIYVTFTAVDAHSIACKYGIFNFTGQVSLLIWTTTPWTLPANRAISIHPNFDYLWVKVEKQNYIIAAALVDSIMTRAGILSWSILGAVKGKMLEFMRFCHPFMEFSVPIILDQSVNLNLGTGAVHIAPGHGQEDYALSQQYNLEVACVVKHDGCYLSDVLPELNGLSVFKANNVILKILHNGGNLLISEQIQHNYPHCYRHKKPIIFVTTPQWFISIDQHNLKERTLANIRNIKWIPDRSQARIESMVSHRPDWCISRQRHWGVPMALFLHNKTKTLHPRTLDLIEQVAQLVEKKGTQAWWDLDLADILGSDAEYYHKVLDTIDVWFDSGSTCLSVVSIRPDLINYIPDMYLEGADQHRGWFMSSMIISTAIHNKLPCRQVLTHGFVVDKQGKKMSKSVGNVISPQQIINRLGADVLRLWVASTDYTNDIVMSDEIIQQSVDLYRRIRNTARFLLANLRGFDSEQHMVSKEKMIILDRWAVGRAKIAQADIINAYNNYDFHTVVQRIVNFCSIEMGSFYLNVIKDRQYTTKADSLARRSCQTAMLHIIEALVRWVAPIISFTAEEIWKFIPGKRSQFIFTEEWYKYLFDLEESHPMNNAYWKILLDVRDETNKIIEQKRAKSIIYSSLEASITLYAEPIIADALLKLGNELCFFLITSRAIVANYNDAGCNALQCEGIKGLKISLTKAQGKKCLRCWHYKIDTGLYTKHSDICGRCVTNIDGPGEIREFI